MYAFLELQPFLLGQLTRVPAARAPANALCCPTPWYVTVKAESPSASLAACEVWHLNGYSADGWKAVESLYIRRVCQNQLLSLCTIKLKHTNHQSIRYEVRSAIKRCKWLVLATVASGHLTPAYPIHSTPAHLISTLREPEAPLHMLCEHFVSLASPLTAVAQTTTMLLQSKGHCAYAQRTSSARPVQRIVAPRRLVVADAALKDTVAVPVMEKGELSVFPEQPAVYAVYNKDGAVQYIGLTRKVGHALGRR